MTLENWSDTLVNEDTQLAQVSNPFSDESNNQSESKRFTLLRPLGKGGTASVFLAYDEQLQRHVAIKMLSNSALDHTLLSEARIQAQIDHPNICKIFQVEEANQHNSNSYLVMQYIEGQSALQWSKADGKHAKLRDILLLMQKVCDGLQVMHAQGIIHRDIKPDNIMLAQDENTGLHPFMVDFGLANFDINNKDILIQTATEGTPTFMSPEQWQNAKLDSRTDVYSFGATLYMLLTGLRPYPAYTNQIPCNQFDNNQWHNLPLAIKTIIRKCMQLERQDRYQSAREVNKELQRYLAGDPIKSLPSKRYWLKTKLLKHKWPVSLLFILAVSTASMTVWTNYQKSQHQFREQLIAQFSSRVENLEANVRLSKLTTRHDITEETERWQLQISQLKAEIESLGEIAFGPGHYAIGRMYFTLQQYDEALTHLQRAWDSGFRQQRVAYNLALSHGAIYQQQKAIVNTISDRLSRKIKSEDLDNKHRQPAIRLLEQSMGNSPYQSFAKAQLQYYQGEYSQALSTLSQAQDLPSWFYQHHVLRGDIYLHKTEQAGATHKADQVQYYAKQALNHYIKAAQIGRSDLQLQLKPAFVYIRLLNTSLYGKQLDFDAIYNDATAILENAAIINPNHYQVHTNKARLFALKRKHEAQYSGDPLKASQQEIDHFKQALALENNNADILTGLGMAYSARIKLLTQRDLPSDHLFPLALEAFGRIKQEDKDQFYYNYFALLNHDLANNKAQQVASKNLSEPLVASNLAIDEQFEKTILAYQDALNKKPDSIAVHLNTGLVYRDWSNWVDPQSARQKVQLAIKQNKKALALNPQHFVANFNIAQNYNRLTRLNTFLSKPVEQEVQLTKQHLDITKLSHPKHPFVILESVNLYTIQGINQWQKGCPYQSWIGQAQADINQAITDNPDNTQLLDGRAWLYTIEQQMAYFNADNQIDDLVAYQQALLAAKAINSQKRQTSILLHLLDNKHQNFNESQLTTLPIMPDARLAYAEWLSQQHQFKQAEAIFASLQRIYPAILSQYRLQHLNRWFNVEPSSAVEQRINKLQTELNTQFSQLKSNQTVNSSTCSAFKSS